MNSLLSDAPCDQASNASIGASSDSKNGTSEMYNDDDEVDVDVEPSLETEAAVEPSFESEAAVEPSFESEAAVVVVVGGGGGGILQTQSPCIIGLTDSLRIGSNIFSIKLSEGEPIRIVTGTVECNAGFMRTA